MIESLINLDEDYDAERYARICYECLPRLVDTQSDEVGDAALALSTIIHLLIANGKEGNIVEVEMLVRKAVLIKERLHGASHTDTARTYSNLCNVLILKGS